MKVAVLALLPGHPAEDDVMCCLDKLSVQQQNCQQR